MKWDYDLTQVPELKPLPDGVYVLKIVEAKERKSSNNNPMIMWETEVLEPEEARKISQKHFIFQVVTPDALFRVRDLFDACGKLTAGGIDTERLYGCSFGAIMELKEDPVTKELRNNIRKFLPLSKTRPQITGKVPVQQETEPSTVGASPVKDDSGL